MRPVYLVGLGRIGAGNVGLAGDIPMSHLAALRQAQDFRIAGLVDSDYAARSAVKAAHPDLAARVAAELGDLSLEPGAVMVVATPPEQRAALMNSILANHPALIVMEKPIAADLKTASDIVRRADAAGVPILVNYHRRFDVRHRAWRERRPKQPRAIMVRYGKGLLNYASHAIDLVCDWYGDVAEVRALGAARAFGAKDWVLSFQCRMAAGFDAIFIGLDQLDYDQLEMDVIASDGVLEWRAGGAQIAWRAPVDDRFYRGYRHLADEASGDEGPVAGFSELYAAISEHLDRGAPPRGCDGKAALKVATILEAALQSAKAGGVPVAPQSLM